MAIIAKIDGYEIYCDGCDKLLNSSVVLLSMETIRKLKTEKVFCKNCKKGKDYEQLRRK